MSNGRRYDGRTAADRAAERRDRLVAAGLELFGTRGYAATPIKAILDEAGLTQRYFYESFADKETLLRAVYDHVVEDVAGAALAAVNAAPDRPLERTRAGFSAFVHALADDRRKARVQLFEVVGVSDDLERRRREVLHFYATFVEQASLELVPPGSKLVADGRLIAMGVVGATNELVIDWILGAVDRPLDDLVEQCTILMLGAARACLEDVREWAETLSTARANERD